MKRSIKYQYIWYKHVLLYFNMFEIEISMYIEMNISK